MKILLQSDFDGTITEKDVSFMMLDTFASNNWRQWLKEYKDGKISVGRFNTQAFSTVRVGRETLLDSVKDKVRIRPGFHSLLAYCRQHNFRLVIVSNGLDFYIQRILKDIGASDIEVFAAATRFGADGVQARYFSPEGEEIEAGFKEAYLRSFQKRGYQVVYVGNGISDAPPAERAYRVFATGDLQNYLSQKRLSYIPFTDFNDVIKGLATLPQ
ncbi:MAG: MtnX-like HAD-IB family phosphatase [Dehalococcoidales bacterium]|nr:MtnX-like HAD-IB family phosphatase [Dehalococcoidales bacterium]